MTILTLPNGLLWNFLITKLSHHTMHSLSNIEGFEISIFFQKTSTSNFVIYNHIKINTND
jgi:hypothetical protein